MNRQPSPKHSNKNRFWLLALLLWVCLAAFIFTVPPATIYHQIAFFIIIFFCLFATLAIVLRSYKLVFLISLFLVTLLIFQVINQLTIINIALLAGLLVAVYFIISTHS